MTHSGLWSPSSLSSASSTAPAGLRWGWKILLSSLALALAFAGGYVTRDALNPPVFCLCQFPKAYTHPPRSHEL